MLAVVGLLLGLIGNMYDKHKKRQNVWSISNTLMAISICIFALIFVPTCLSQSSTGTGLWSGADSVQSL